MTRKAGEYFAVSVQAMGQIAAQGGGPEEVLGYLVLARHASFNVKPEGKVTSAGAYALQNKVGMSYRTAKGALGWLSENSAQLSDDATAEFIVSAEKAKERLGAERVPNHFGPGPKGSFGTTMRWFLPTFEDSVYLPNALVDGIAKGDVPPLTRIYNDVQPDIDGGIGKQDARLDAAVLLMYLYGNTELEKCGGVDPRSGLYREWAVVDDDAAGWLDRPPVTSLEGTNAALYEVHGKSKTVFLSFAATALAYVLDPDERTRRFWCAFNNLLRLGFVYEVLTVWNDSPVGEDKKKSKRAELLYTLYIFDKHARDQEEPYLQREIHSMALSRGDIDPLEMGFDSSGQDSDTLLTSGRFRFVAVEKIGAHPLGVYRLRFRPKDRTTGRWIEAERQRCLDWANHFRSISDRPHLTEWARPPLR